MMRVWTYVAAAPFRVTDVRRFDREPDAVAYAEQLRAAGRDLQFVQSMETSRVAVSRDMRAHAKAGRAA